MFQQALSHDPGLSTWFIAAFTLIGRFLVAALLLFKLRGERPSRLELQQGAGLGVFAGIGMLSQMDALNFTEASTSAFLTQGYVVILPLVAVVVQRRLPSLRIVISVGTMVVGLAILSRFDVRTFALGRGEAETLLAACFFALQILWLDRRVYAENRSGPVTLVMFATIAAVLLPVAAASARRASDFSAVLVSGSAVATFALLTLLCTLAAFWLMNHFQPRLTPSEAGVIYGAEPVFASLFALGLPGLLSTFQSVAYPNEVLSERLLVGGGLVTLANLFLQLRARAVEAPQSSRA